MSSQRPPDPLPSAADRPETFPFGPSYKALDRAVRMLADWPRYAALSALRSLERGWKIAPIDPEMAVFRAITAEEEAATCLILALKSRQYPGAQQLNPRNHTHKNGLAPFLKVVEGVIAKTGLPAPKVSWNFEGKRPRVDAHFASEGFGLAPGDLITPDEPLNGVLSGGDEGGPRSTMTFEEDLQAVADGRGLQHMLELMEAQANLRNQILYAGANGIPVVTEPDPILKARWRSVALLLGLAIAVLQTPVHQLLVVQALRAYLLALKKVPPDYDFDAAVAGNPEWTIEVVRQEGALVSAGIKRRPSPAPAMDLRASGLANAHFTVPRRQPEDDTP